MLVAAALFAEALALGAALVAWRWALDARLAKASSAVADASARLEALEAVAKRFEERVRALEWKAPAQR